MVDLLGGVLAHSTKTHGKQPQGRQTQSDGRGGGRVFYLLGGLIVVAGVAWFLVARGGGSIAESPTPAEFEGLAATTEADRSVGITMGSESAPIEIMEFADYSCPHCAEFTGFAGKLLRQNYVEPADGPVRWVLYDFVLGGFPNTIPAAMAARCAGEQGAYWPMHDLLFSRQRRWQTNPSPGGEFLEMADDVGLDSGSFKACMSEGRYIDQIAAARRYGDQLGVSSTPTLFLNGKLIALAGNEPYSYIENLIQAELASPGKGTTGDDGGS